jgi:hypothetical protein
MYIHLSPKWREICYYNLLQFNFKNNSLLVIQCTSRQTRRQHIPDSIAANVNRLYSALNFAMNKMICCSLSQTLKLCNIFKICIIYLHGMILPYFLVMMHHHILSFLSVPRLIFSLVSIKASVLLFMASPNRFAS